MANDIPVKHRKIFSRYKSILEKILQGHGRDRRSLYKHLPKPIYRTLRFLLRLIVHKNIKISPYYLALVNENKNLIIRASNLNIKSLQQELSKKSRSNIKKVVAVALKIGLKSI